MTSLKQIEANRRNALRSTGPRTEQGKQRASQNAVRHGLTAETVIVPLEDAADYQAFEQAVTADYDAETAVERELVLRLASLLWRLRRATSIETGLLGVAQEHAGPMQEIEEHNRPSVTSLFSHQPAVDRSGESAERRADSLDIELDVVLRFVRLADLESGLLERLGRYESSLWRQVRQTIFTLEGLRLRTSSHRKWRIQRSWMAQE